MTMSLSGGKYQNMITESLVALDSVVRGAAAAAAAAGAVVLCCCCRLHDVGGGAAAAAAAVIIVGDQALPSLAFDAERLLLVCDEGFKDITSDVLQVGQPGAGR
jgi:hypothetical protein